MISENTMIRFLKITIQAKDPTCDWRAFLDWTHSGTSTVYQLRGYGSTPGEAAEDAWSKFNDNRDEHIADEWGWK